MSLRLIYGRAGTGKSEFCLKEIKTKLSKNMAQKIYIIVPEQFSYATEKRLLETLETDSTVNAEVINFKRLAHRVSLEIGENTKTKLTKVGKSMLVKYITDKNKSNLNFLGRTNEIDLTLRTITELKKHNISIKKLQEQLENTKEQLLKLKLEDINLIYSMYEQIIRDNYIDEEDILTILSKQIEYSKMFDNSIVYIDEFSGFTEQEYLIIEEILKKAKQVSINICADELEEKNRVSDLFYPNKQVIKKIIEHAKNANIKIEKPIELKECFRFKNKELQVLEENIYAIRNEKYNEEVKHINLKLCNNPYTEVEETAKTIIKLVREKNIRYNDIAIVTKNIEDYESAITAIFPQYNIPVFIDNKKALSDNILVKYVLSIFDIYSKNWSADSVWSYIKTGFTDVEKNDVYKLENYCKKWGIRGNKWYKENWNYDALNKDIENLNNLRKIIVNPLIELNETLKNKKTAKEITKALYDFLEKNKIKNKLEEKLKKLEENEEIKYANEYISSWNILMNILDEINLVFGEQKFTFEEYREILKSGLEVSSFGEIPEVIDQVIIGDIDRSKSHKIDTLFILGINDGVFPSQNNDEGFFNDSDRELLKNNGLELAKGTLENLYDEQYNIYKAFTTAENDIYLSYVSTDKEGKAKRPSTLITKVKKIFPKLEEKSDVIKETSNITTSSATFKELLLNIRKLRNNEEVDYIWKDIYNWYINNRKWKAKIENVINGFYLNKTAEKISEKNIKRLYGGSLKTSISRLEQYKKCPFSFHLKYGLKLKEKEELKIKSIDTGTFMHDIIDTFFETIDNVKEITEEEIEKNVENIINQKLELNKNYIFTSSPKFTVLTNRLKKVVTQSIKYIVFQIQNSDFEVLGNEIEFKKKIDNVEIIGKIDRLDVAKTENGQYIRIIDYKSSEKNIDLNELVAGTQIQLITYLDSVVKEEKNVLPAGMLYFKMIDPIIKSDKSKNEEQIKEELKKKFKMNGMILADVNVIKKMDKNLEKGASSVIPVYLDKDGNISNSRSNVLTKEQFTKLQKTAEKIIKEIAKDILSGNIDIKPVYNRKTKSDVCKYCEYKTICRFDSKVNHYTFINNKSKEEILEIINIEN